MKQSKKKITKDLFGLKKRGFITENQRRLGMRELYRQNLNSVEDVFKAINHG